MCYMKDYQYPDPNNVGYIPTTFIIIIFEWME